MGNIILTGLLVVAAIAAMKWLRGHGEASKSRVEEAARRATERMAKKHDAETLEADADGVYRPRKQEAGE